MDRESREGARGSIVEQMESFPERRRQGVRNAPRKRTSGPVHPVGQQAKAAAIRTLGDRGPARKRSEPTVFIPPQPTTTSRGSDDAELSTVPRNLQRAITFLHQEIKIRTRTGRTSRRTPVGELFKNADLVEQFELAAVLSHLERLLSGPVSTTTYRQALSWVYTQERASRANVADLARLGLHVPTVSGWLPASRAVFSPGWETRRARAVAALVHESAGVSPSLQALGEVTIANPEHWPFKLGDMETFRDFLFRCGVRDGLFPVALRSRTAIRMNGHNFTAAGIANRFELADYEEWSRHISETWHGHLEGPYTPYTGERELWIVPGQDAFETLDGKGKDGLAAAILDSLADWPKEVESYVSNGARPAIRRSQTPRNGRRQRRPS